MLAMADSKIATKHIFAAHGDSEAVRPLPRTSFSQQGLGEVKHLQKWVLNNPEVLDEELLVVTREYDGFDRSNRRLDILALDKSGKLVVVELKLDTNGHFADLQAINYAAMVSTLTMDDVVRLLARYRGSTVGEATAMVVDFLDAEDGELLELDDHPRMIIAAGGFGGLEITSTALWLRSFGVDIKLVELAPYLMGDKSVILVPRVVIPLPEASNYIVGHEKKDGVQRRSASSQSTDYRPFLEAIASEFGSIAAPFTCWFEDSNRSGGRNYLGFSPRALGLRHADVHYEWVLNRRGFTVGLHFERPANSDGRTWNLLMADRLQQLVVDAQGDRSLERIASGTTWHWVGYTLSTHAESADMSEEGVRLAAQAMMDLVALTKEPLESLLAQDGAGYQ